jgi:hypothetical protein
MDPETSSVEDFEDSLAEGIAAVIAAGDGLAGPADMADLFLEELNRLWSEPLPADAAEAA